ncbi:sensor histidine kinase, partial [bacterium]|nr:sensor histidine kinase [bacterium]
DITERKTADDQIKKDLKEKEILLREIHHRVKNNLQIIKSLLNLQADQVKSKTLINAFNECVARIQSMAMVHEQLYYSDDLTNIPFRTYIKKMSNELIRSYHLKTVIALNLKIEDIFLSIDKAIPLGLILNELLTNAMKYAFLEMEKGRITISLQIRKDQFYELIFQDNGIGIPEDIDFEKTESLGLYLIKILTQQIDGTVMVTREHGTAYTIVFPRV